MTTKEMYDKGVRCKGAGFNCLGCEDKNNCVESITYISELQHIREKNRKRYSLLYNNSDVKKE